MNTLCPGRSLSETQGNSLRQHRRPVSVLRIGLWILQLGFFGPIIHTGGVPASSGTTQSLDLTYERRAANEARRVQSRNPSAASFNISALRFSAACSTGSRFGMNVVTTPPAPSTRRRDRATAPTPNQVAPFPLMIS